MKSRLEDARDQIEIISDNLHWPVGIRDEIRKILDDWIEREKEEDLGTLRKMIPGEEELSCFWQIKQILDSMSDHGVGRVIAYFRDLSENGR